MLRNKQRVVDPELKKAVSAAWRAVAKSLAAEPSTVIISGSADNDPGCPGDDIAAWLFHRRQEDSNANNSVNH
jgi:hypothetical protein